MILLSILLSLCACGPSDTIYGNNNYNGVNEHSKTEYCTAIPGEQIIRKTHLVISYNLNEKIPNYVGYAVTRDMINGTATRESNFHQEELLAKEYRQTNNDYVKSGYDKGHMSPAADWKYSQTAMHESFCLSNVCPQNPTLNRQYWSRIEDTERYLTYNCDTMFVITGSILGDEGISEKLYIGNNVRVPDAFYKACVGVHDHEVIFTIAWVFDNNGNEQKQDDREISIEKLENIIGLDLFAGMWFNEMKEDLIIGKNK